MQLSTSRNLLEHSFYRRWLKGTLSGEELRDYAAQYAHVVRALPAWLQLAGGRREHAAEEERHLELWLRFARALGLSAREVQATEPNAATRALLQAGYELSAGSAGIAVAWAIESQSAPVSEEKLSGLADHYGIAGDGAEYFRLHASLDIAHTSELESALDHLAPADQTRAQAISDTIQARLWDLLSSVEQAA